MFQRPETYATSTLIALAARMNVFQCAVSSLFFSMCLQCAVSSLFFSLCFKLVSTKDSKDESDEESNVDNELYLPYILYPPQPKVDI